MLTANHGEIDKMSESAHMNIIFDYKFLRYALLGNAIVTWEKHRDSMNHGIVESLFVAIKSE